MSRLPRPNMTVPAPGALAAAAVLGTVLTVALDMALLWWVALIIGVAAAFALVVCRCCPGCGSGATG